jgi:glycosyltransferase involved in cell wall biosynthesis
MRIAIIAHIRHPIATPFMGGMEAHSHALAAALVQRGHDVTLFASGDSRPPAGVRLHPIVAHHYDRDFPWHRFHGTDELNAHLDAAFASILPALREGGFDVVHNNSLHRYPPRLARRDRVPMLTSLHVPPFDALRRAVHASGAGWNRFTVCSEAQMTAWADSASDLPAHVVYNGIDTERWAFHPEGDGTAVWFGRITPTKGTGEAVQAARYAGLPLRIFGPVEHQDYFDQAVKPYLGPTIAYCGNRDPDALAHQVSRASVCLFTPRWNEPFGLAAAEAMSCGVPVAAFDAGAVSEVVADGGVIVKGGDVIALATAALRAARMDRRAVRDLAVVRFALPTMIDRYEDLYRHCIAERDSPACAVHFPPIELPAEPPARGGVLPLAAE